MLLEELVSHSGFGTSVLFYIPGSPSSRAVCMQPDSCRKIKLDLIFNSMGGFGFGGIKAL